MKDPTSWVNHTREHNVPRHRQDRADNGFSTYDWWNADSYIAWIVLGICQKFRTEGNGYPMQMTLEQWNEYLIDIEDCMRRKLIDDYDSIYDEVEGLAAGRRGMRLFADKFNSFWD